jgi:hypothetical protein
MAGPLPDLDVPLPGPIPSLDMIDESSPEKATPEGVLSDLQTGFKILLALSVPFIVYVVSWKAGFDVANVAYAMLGIVMVGSTVAYWARARGHLPANWIAPVRRIRNLRWVPLQVVPLVGFELWRHTWSSSVYALVALLAIAWSFIATVGWSGSQ